MNKDAQECFDTAASLLQQAINNAAGVANTPTDPRWCQPSVAHTIVELIGMGTIKWSDDDNG